MRYEREQFENMVATSLDGLPERVQEQLENVAVCVEPKPSKEQLRETGTRRGNTLLGLYEGVPKTAWGRGFGGNLPDKITIFQDSIEQIAQSAEQVAELVQSTVRHEIAHHFGFSDEDLEEREHS